MNTQFVFKVKVGLLAIFVTLLFCAANNEKLCETYSISLNKVSPYYDGQWQGIIAASDGACYFGSSSHSLIHGGGFFRFDSKTKKFDVLTDDFSKLVGTDLNINTPQGKCHSPIIEIDSILYLATHLAAYWDDILDKYEGSHLLTYNLKSKKWRDYGVIKPRYSTYSAIEVDKVRGKIYAMVVPFAPQDKLIDGNHLFQIDIKTGSKRDLGRLSDGHGSFWFYLDNRGRLWTPIWKGTNILHCYDPDIDSIITYKNAFPEPKLAPDGKPVITPQFPGLAWTWAKSIDNGKRCLFTMGDNGGGDERLWVFDPSKDIRTKEAFTPICYIGSTFLSVALGGNRVYYSQREDITSLRNSDTESARELPPDKQGYQVTNLHLRSVALNQNDKHPFIDHGRIIDQEGRTPGMISSLAADDKGNIYINGSWLVKPGDQPTLQYQHDVKNGKKYKTLIRGEFFAWVNVSKDLE